MGIILTRTEFCPFIVTSSLLFISSNACSLPLFTISRVFAITYSSNVTSRLLLPLLHQIVWCALASHPRRTISLIVFSLFTTSGVNHLVVREARISRSFNFHFFWFVLIFLWFDEGFERNSDKVTHLLLKNLVYQDK